MHRKTLGSVLTLGAALAVATAAACDDDDDDGTGPGADTFEAQLTVANEVPPVQAPSNASGRAAFDFDNGTVDYVIEVNDITNVILAHIHFGPAGVAGPILVTLFTQAAPGTGPLDEEELVRGSFDAGDIQGLGGEPPISLDSLRTLLGNGQTYVNVHTVQNPAGEIRGQIQED